MIVFSPQPLEKWFFYFIVRQRDTPHEESKYKIAQLLQWVPKDDDVYFKTIIASQICGNSFAGFYTTCCCRHMASLGLNGLSEAMGSHRPWARSYLSMLTAMAQQDENIPSLTNRSLIWSANKINIWRVWYSFSHACVTIVSLRIPLRHHYQWIVTSSAERKASEWDRGVDVWISSLSSIFTNSLCRVRNTIMHALSLWTDYALTRVLFWCFSSLMPKSRNKSK